MTLFSGAEAFGRVCGRSVDNSPPTVHEMATAVRGTVDNSPDSWTTRFTSEHCAPENRGCQTNRIPRAHP